MSQVEQDGNEKQVEPTWEIVEDAGLAILHWQGPGKLQGLPLGKIGDVEQRLADWLAQRDFGE